MYRTSIDTAFGDKTMQSLSTELLNWYDRERRDLPWRRDPGETADAYHVWMSEIMLQQTTVAAVKSYFAKFTKLWPTVEAMASAPLDDVLKEWAGLGYYARARNLHKCATVVVTEHDGQFPRTEAELKKLPGIGDYTAAAVAAIAFGERAVVVDGNIERVVTRLNRITEELPGAKKSIKAATDDITPSTRAGDFAQAMMDLGATICTPKSPKCLLCPVSSHCQALRAGDQETYPRKKPKQPKPTRRAVSYWVTCGEHILLERRPAKGLLGGMPGLFSTLWESRDGFPKYHEVERQAPVSGPWTALSGVAKHTFTHFHLETQIFHQELRTLANVDGGFWARKDDIADVGLPTVFTKMVSIASAQNS